MIIEMGLLYMGQGQMSGRVQAEGSKGQVYGNWRGPSKIRPEADALVKLILHYYYCVV